MRTYIPVLGLPKTTQEPWRDHSFWDTLVAALCVMHWGATVSGALEVVSLLDAGAVESLVRYEKQIRSIDGAELDDY